MGIKIGIIGGSGLDNLNIFTNARDTFTGTVWGEPSSPLREGEIAGIPVAVLARHGRSHTIAPSSVNYRANIQTLKDAGCTHILATTATGSLREEIRRGDLVILDQFIDFTKQRKMTFHDYFKPGQPVHAPMAEPFDATLRQILIDGCRKNDFPFHPTGTVVTIEGPRFSTKAESRMFRMWGADVINMSVSTETALANEADIPYAAVAMSTDYDCWKEDEAPVSWEEVSLVFKQNAEKVTTLLVESVPAIAQEAALTPAAYARQNKDSPKGFRAVFISFCEAAGPSGTTIPSLPAEPSFRDRQSSRLRYLRYGGNIFGRSEWRLPCPHFPQSFPHSYFPHSCGRQK